MYFVYILQSIKDNSFYIGHTSNIESRLWEDNFGRTRYTKLKRPWKVIYKESFITRSEAMKREKKLKNLKSKVALEKIIEEPGR